MFTSLFIYNHQKSLLKVSLRIPTHRINNTGTALVAGASELPPIRSWGDL